MFKLMDKEIITILRKLFLLNWTYVIVCTVCYCFNNLNYLKFKATTSFIENKKVTVFQHDKSIKRGRFKFGRNRLKTDILFCIFIAEDLPSFRNGWSQGRQPMLKGPESESSVPSFNRQEDKSFLRSLFDFWKWK